MAFPTIPTVGAGRVVTGVTTGTTSPRTFPSLSGLTKDPGDLLIAIVVAYQSSATANTVWSSWGGGFTEFVDQSTTTTMAIGAAYKWSTGSETGTFTVVQAATITGQAAFILLSIPGAHASTPPEGGTIINGTAAAANIAALASANWGTEDTLWIAVGGNGRTNTSGQFTGLTVAPSSYGNFAGTGTSGGGAIGDTWGAVAFRQNTAGSEDPATFTVDTSNARNSALLVAVRPTPEPNDLVVQADGTSTVTADLSDSAVFDIPYLVMAPPIAA